MCAGFARGWGPRSCFHQFRGYRVEVAESQLDSLRFASLVKAAAGSEPAQAIDHLHHALRLWRGAAFEDLRDNLHIAGEAGRLDEERLRVEADYAALALRLGRHHEVVPYLVKLTETHPYREDFRAHLMVALYRCGRQKDALELFRATHELLKHELGIEPGAQLRRVQEAILRNDPELELPERPYTTVPRQLPAGIAAFIGRGEHLRVLDGMLPDPARMRAKLGQGG